MKALCLLLFFFSTVHCATAQDSDFEAKVISTKYQHIKGLLKKVSAEGIAIEDYKGHYFILRANEIIRIKIRKRGLTIGEGTGGGAVLGLGIGGLILSLDENGDSLGELAVFTVFLTGSGAALGLVTGIIAEIVNTKTIVRVNGDEQKFRAEFKTLEKYVSKVYTEHVN